MDIHFLIMFLHLWCQVYFMPLMMISGQLWCIFIRDFSWDPPIALNWIWRWSLFWFPSCYISPFNCLQGSWLTSVFSALRLGVLVDWFSAWHTVKFSFDKYSRCPGFLIEETIALIMHATVVHYIIFQTDVSIFSVCRLFLF